jgi:uncharacterized repeat protein (TIGR03803 family)
MQTLESICRQRIARLCAAVLAISVLPVSAKATTFTMLASHLSHELEISAVQGATAIGTTRDRGLTGSGTVFAITPAGRLVLLHSFVGPTEGSSPNDVLAVDSVGNIYGTTNMGGKFHGGTVFELTNRRVLKVLHSFDAAAGDGSNPHHGLVLGPLGELFGAASAGAIATNGSIFEVSSSGVYHNRYYFKSLADGHCPFSGVAVDKQGFIFGTVVGNGFGGDPNGAIWKLSPTNRLTPLYIFKDGADGEYPDQSPIIDAAGNLYGTIITRNGTEYAGAIWKVDTAGKFSLIHRFTGMADGFGPNGPLLANIDGNLYGTTSSGGNLPGKPGDGYGTVFRITPSGQFTVIHTFTGKDGSNPSGTLAHDSKGAIYGATTGNSGSIGGTVFKITP